MRVRRVPDGPVGLSSRQRWLIAAVIAVIVLAVVAGALAAL